MEDAQESCNARGRFWVRPFFEQHYSMESDCQAIRLNRLVTYFVIRGARNASNGRMRRLLCSSNRTHKRSNVWSAKQCVWVCLGVSWCVLVCLGVCVCGGGVGVGGSVDVC